MHIASGTSVLKSPATVTSEPYKQETESVMSAEWREWDEETCEQRLQVDPMDNFARFRYSEILVYENQDY